MKKSTLLVGAALLGVTHAGAYFGGERAGAALVAESARQSGESAKQASENAADANKYSKRTQSALEKVLGSCVSLIDEKELKTCSDLKETRDRLAGMIAPLEGPDTKITSQTCAIVGRVDLIMGELLGKNADMQCGINDSELQTLEAKIDGMKARCAEEEATQL